jgi:hypothetical protein
MQNPVDIIYKFSHLIVALILVFCLKQKKKILLILLQTVIIAYLIHNDRKLLYILPTMGLIIFVSEQLISYDPYSEESTIYNIIQNIWKLPFYTILSYYLIQIDI